MKPIMDPSKKFGFNLDFDKFWWKLKIILLVFCLNSLSILSLMMAAHYFLDEKTIFKIVADYIVRQWIFFTEQNWTNFSLFFKTYCIKTPIIEEFIYRYYSKYYVGYRPYRIFTIVGGYIWAYSPISGRSHAVLAINKNQNALAVNILSCRS